MEPEYVNIKNVDTNVLIAKEVVIVSMIKEKLDALSVKEVKFVHMVSIKGGVKSAVVLYFVFIIKIAHSTN